MTRADLSGVYLVVDPAMDRAELLNKVEQALQGGVEILQIWNHWPGGITHSGKEQLVGSILEIAGDYDVPVLINEEWELLKTTRLHGVHFDAVPDDLEAIRRAAGRAFIAGVTCSNDLQVVRRAEEAGMDYISFCAMFPSPSVDSCEIVQPETVKKARELTSLPLFVSGGITLDNLRELEELDISGVAVISGILNADVPRDSALAYRRALEKRN